MTPICSIISIKTELVTNFSADKINTLYSEAVGRRCFVKNVSLKISQNSQENTCPRVSFFNKVAALEISKNTLFTEHVWATTSGP